ncbi:hypothetical protein B6U84_03480 [Candidatus Bathyarchaeota archaeon ex4484_40]|nr:MAG: hypothetical protein B6U84_03480 [Candidatus Bathyarchaeota archaeon ex4484_40]
MPRPSCGKGPDLEVQDFLVELKCATDYNLDWILNGFKHQPKPHIVLFLAANDSFLSRLIEKAKAENYKLKYKILKS